MLNRDSAKQQPIPHTINMKNDKLNKLPIVPEEYEVNVLDRIDFSLIHSEMVETERRFVNGLVRYYKPKNILEIGVSRGGGSVVLLNAISDMPESRLVSIDRAESYYGSPDFHIAIGCDVDTVKLSKDKWKLITGKDPSEVMESLDIKFDFVVIDTAHIHPVESLNFLCVLPFLNDGAIVIFHDIANHMLNENQKDHIGDIRKFQASIIVFSTIVGEKLIPKTKSFPTYFIKNKFVNNIGAVQITPDTHKYISNVFTALCQPWLIDVRLDVENIRNLLAKYFDQTLVEYFDDAFECYLNSFELLSSQMNNIPQNTVFYGAGYNMRVILNAYYALGKHFRFPIWDKSAEQIKFIDGHEVSLPDFDTKVSGRNAVITIGDLEIYEEVMNNLKDAGFNIIEGIFDELPRYGSGYSPVN